MKRILLIALAAVTVYSMKHGIGTGWIPSRGSRSLPDPLAVKVGLRDGRGMARAVMVWIVSGPRWRVEIKDPVLPSTAVAVFDGEHYFARPERLDVKKLDPNLVLIHARRLLAKGRPTKTESVAGRRCHLYQEGVYRVWFDAGNGLPVRWIGPMTQEEAARFTHVPVTLNDWQFSFTGLAIDVAAQADDLFNGANLNPEFTAQLRANF